MACTSNSRNKSSRKKEANNKYDNPKSLTLSDVQCSACMGIFIEPVTLPCYHAMCKDCFQRTVDNNPLSCPLCRKYIGGWIRRVQKSGQLVNDKLWHYVRTNFAIHVQKKLAGEEDEEMEELARQTPSRSLSEPGEIRQEYEAEQVRLREEARKREELEAEASRELIQQLQAIEEVKREQELQELLKREEEDARLAQRLAQEMDQKDQEMEEARSAFVSLHKKSSSSTSHPVIRGPMDAFLSQSPALRTDSACSTDSLQSELQHFKPLVTAPCTPPKVDPSGKLERTLPIRVPVMRDLETSGTTNRTYFSSISSPLRPWESSGKRAAGSSRVRFDKQPSCSNSSKRPSTDTSANSPKRVCSVWSSTDMEVEDDDEGYAGSDRSKEQDGTEIDAGMLPLSEAELRLQLAAAERLRQEMLDRDLALRLQAELDAESAPVYQLRSSDNAPKVTPPRKAQPRKKSVPTPKDNRRQRTLEETMGVSRQSLRTTLK